MAIEPCYGQCGIADLRLALTALQREQEQRRQDLVARDLARVEAESRTKQAQERAEFQVKRAEHAEATLTQLREENARLRARADKLREENARLEERLEEALRHFEDSPEATLHDSEGA